MGAPAAKASLSGSEGLPLGKAWAPSTEEFYFSSGLLFFSLGGSGRLQQGACEQVRCTVMYSTVNYCAVMYVLYYTVLYCCRPILMGCAAQQGHGLGPLPRQHRHTQHRNRPSAVPLRLLLPDLPQGPSPGARPLTQVGSRGYLRVHSHHCGSSEPRPRGVLPGFSDVRAYSDADQLAVQSTGGGAALGVPRGTCLLQPSVPHAFARLGYRAGASGGRRTARRW